MKKFCLVQSEGYMPALQKEISLLKEFILLFYSILREFHTPNI